MNYIKINVETFKESININIDMDRNTMMINNESKDIIKKQIEIFFRIIREWESEYYNSSIIDDEKFSIEIIANKSDYHITGYETIDKLLFDIEKALDKQKNKNMKI